MTLLAFFHRDFLVQRSYPWGYLWSVLAVLFTSASFYFLGKLIPPGPALAAYGGNYFAFVMVGLVLARFQAVGLNAFVETWRREASQGTLESLWVSALSRRKILAGLVAWESAYAGLEAAAYIVIGIAFFGWKGSWTGIPAGIITFLLAMAAFFALGLVSLAIVVRLKRGNPVAWVVGALFELLGGVYFPVTVLPTVLQDVSGWIPMTRALEAFRLALLQGASLSALWSHWVVLAGFTLVVAPLGAALLQRALQAARRDGSLSHT